MLSFPTRSQCWSFLHSLNPTLSYKISILSFPTRSQSCPFLQDINPVFSWNLLILPFPTRSLSSFFSSTCTVSPFLPLSPLFPPPPIPQIQIPPLPLFVHCSLMRFIRQLCGGDEPLVYNQLSTVLIRVKGNRAKYNYSPPARTGMVMSSLPLTPII